MCNNATGNYNTASGDSSLSSNTTGNNNTAMGASALYGLTSGSGNVGIGYGAGSSITTGNNNVVIGSNGGSSVATLSNYVLISDGAGNLKMTMDNSGNVGIGTASPGNMLQVGSTAVTAGTAVASFVTAAGTCTMTPASSGSGIACSSDERLKENIDDVSGQFVLDKILKLQAVTYKFKADKTGKRHTGYIAQALQKLAPEFVRVNDDGYLQVYYDGLIPWITEAVKTIYNRLTGVEATVKKLELENAELKARAQKIEQENIEIKARLEKIEKSLKSK